MKKLQKVEQRAEKQEKQKEQFTEYLHGKREKSEWKAVQGALLSTLQDRLSQWKYTGTWEARKELYDLLNAASAALKAQYFKSSEGKTPEENAFHAAKMAVHQMGHATTAQKHAMAKQAAEMFMKQDAERKREMIMLDEAIKMLGPVEKAKADPNLNKRVDLVHDLL